MHRDSLVMREIDRSRCGAPIDRGEPSGIAVGEDIDPLAFGFARRDGFDQLEPVAAHGPVDGDVLLADLGGAPVGCGEPLRARTVAQRAEHLVERPAKINRGRAAGGERRIGALQRFVRRVGAHREIHSIGGRRPDQRGAAHLHGLDRPHRVVERYEPHRREAKRQERLIDDADVAALFEPDAARGLSVDLHATHSSMPET
jgi:hypothetical protein